MIKTISLDFRTIMETIYWVALVHLSSPTLVQKPKSQETTKQNKKKRKEKKNNNNN